MRSRKLAILAAAGTVAASLTAAHPASAASPDVVISQVYGGGGNSGATFTNDFIELHNRGTAAVTVTGWSVQYASASGTSWQVTPLTGSIPPGGHYLVQEAAGAGGTTPLPTPDATGSIAMSAASGKVALATSTTPVTGSASAKDFVGYGAANDFEGTPAAGLSNTTAALRGGGPDTDNNGADFTAGAPNPRSSGGGTDPDPEPEPNPKRIREIQGTAHRSPLTGQVVTDVPGVVTAVGASGFWFQDAEPDTDPATSEGLYVFTSARPGVAVGDRVNVIGTVAEYRPGDDAENLTLTELTKPRVSTVERGVAVPAPTLLGPGGRQAPVPVRTDAPGDVEASTVFDPAANALDFYESLEGMLLRVTDAVATGPTNSFGELSVLPGGAGTPRTARGGVRYTYADANAERVILDDTLASAAQADTGDVLPGNVDGVLDYSFGNFKLFALATPAVLDRSAPRETTRAQRHGELAIATYNVENLDPGDPQPKFDRLAAGIVTGLSSPDILTLEEVQDNNGATNDGTVAADRTYALLIEAIVRAGGPRYQYRQIDPTNGADGGEPGGNIRVAFLFRTDRGVSFVDRPGGDATTATSVRRAGFLRPALTASPGRIDPQNAAFANSRKPLAGEFSYKGKPVFVIANHFNSKGGDQPLFGRYQPPARSSEVQRHQQATVVRGFVDQIRNINPLASIVVLGDINDFEFSETADILVGDQYLQDLPRWLPPAERYTYVFDGNSQVLDHIFISVPLFLRGFDYDVVHLNAEYRDQDSDHDPQVVRLRL
ncbi:endonuclease [Virgisporangium aliadipatigenens]|uniref:Endonuclease n=1 Tax=Virgisporangium aliadipatigenens TaxID=741659 RepID=A0A8J3YW43_9ACTN|nr:lamin tail domain-containing protein [Virgisporangium aliadipatigenens]GIJ51618.1 endonuclease [Virgisporangium aliadipatigenens]